jgi:hypothetical protein
MSNLTLRQTTTATDPGSTTAKNSSLSHTEMDSNLILLNTDKLENISEDTTPSLGGTLNTADQSIENTGGANNFIDIATRVRIDENAADYSLLLDNQNTQGLGLKIKAGDDAYAGSLAILSVADKDDTLAFTVKASGEVIVYDNLTVHDVYISSPSAGLCQISTLVGDDLNITTNAGTLSLNSLNFPGSDGSANQVLKTDGAGNLSFTTVNVQSDTDPTLGARLDLNGNVIQDDTRDYQLIGNVSALNTSDYDATNNLSRVRGVVKIHEVDTPTQRVHSHPILTKVTAGADSSDSTNRNAGRLRYAYIDSQYDLRGYDNTTTGFGQGFNSSFSSGVARNDDPSNGASTLSQQTGLTITPQQYSASTGGLTVTDCRAINMEPNVNDSNCTVTNLYGLYYNSIGSGTVTNEYSFYGNVNTAPAYNAGGFTPGAFASTAMPTATNYPNGTIVSISDNSYKPAYQAGGTWKYVADDSAV